MLPFLSKSRESLGVISGDILLAPRHILNYFDRFSTFDAAFIKPSPDLCAAGNRNQPTDPSSLVLARDVLPSTQIGRISFEPTSTSLDRKYSRRR